MNKNLKIKKIFATVIISSILNQVVFPIEVVTNTEHVNDKLKKDGKNIEMLKNQKDKNIKKQSDLNSKLSDLVKKISNLEKKINTIRKNSDDSQDEIFKLRDTIDNLKGEVNNLDSQIKNLNENIETLTNSLLDTIKKTYMCGLINPLEEIIKADSFTSLLNILKYNEAISNETSRMVEAYKAKVNEIEAIKKLRQKQIQDITNSEIKFNENCENNTKRAEDLEVLLKEFYSMYENTKHLLNQTDKQTKDITNTINILNQAKDNIEKKDKELQEIQNKDKDDKDKNKNDKNQQGKNPEQQKEKEPQKKNEKTTSDQQNNKTTSEKNSKSSNKQDKEGFIYPVGGTSSISQKFNKGHKGVDIETKGKANNVFAAKDGRVVVASKKEKGYSGYGYVIEIDHGNNVHTLYAHLSVIKVKKGDKVVKGQLIGNVGNTGKVSGATGMHLHYEKRIKGKQVNPL